MRQGSAPNYCPPIEEGVTFVFEDENGDQVELEFLGLILHEGRRYGFFMEVTDLDEDGQPAEFELVEDEAIALEVYADFREATKDLYDFE